MSGSYNEKFITKFTEILNSTLNLNIYQFTYTRIWKFINCAFIEKEKNFKFYKIKFLGLIQNINIIYIISIGYSIKKYPSYFWLI